MKKGHIHDALLCPKDGVVVEFVGGVEGQVVALLPSGVGAAVAVDVGLHPPLASPHVAQELEVQLVVRLLVDVPVRQLHTRREERMEAALFNSFGIDEQLLH
jgi:hypothetical protein